MRFNEKIKSMKKKIHDIVNFVNKDETSSKLLLPESTYSKPTKESIMKVIEINNTDYYESIKNVNKLNIDIRSIGKLRILTIIFEVLQYVTLIFSITITLATILSKDNIFEGNYYLGLFILVCYSVIMLFSTILLSKARKQYKRVIVQNRALEKVKEIYIDIVDYIKALVK